MAPLIAYGDAPVDIFRIQVDNQGHGSYGNVFGYGNGGFVVGIGGGSGEVAGTVWFKNTSGDDLHNVKVRIVLFDKRQYHDEASKSYDVGTVNPSQIVSQNFRFYTLANTYLVPVVTVQYELNGVKGEQKTRYTDSY